MANNLISPPDEQPDAGSKMMLQKIAAFSGKMQRKAASHFPPQPASLSSCEIRARNTFGLYI